MIDKLADLGGKMRHNQRYSDVAALMSPLVMAGFVYATITLTLRAHADDIGQLKQQLPGIYRLHSQYGTLERQYGEVNAALRDLREYEERQHTELRASMEHLRRDLIQWRQAPTAMPGAVMPPTDARVASDH